MSAIRPGAYVKLNETINCIPEGVYRVEESDSDHMLLSVGRKIRVGLIGAYSDFVVSLTSSAGRSRRISQKEFLDRYYDLLAESSNDPGSMIDLSRPFTTCMLDPSVAREIH